MSCKLPSCHSNTVWQYRNCGTPLCPMKTDEDLEITTSSPKPEPVTISSQFPIIYRI